MAAFCTAFCNCHLLLHNPPPQHLALKATTVCLAVVPWVCSWARAQLGDCSVTPGWCLGPHCRLQCAPWWLPEGGVPHTPVCWLKQGGGGGRPMPLREAVYSAWRLNNARAAREGKPHPQAVFKPLLVTHLLLCQWGCRASGQGQGWCERVSKGLGQREG